MKEQATDFRLNIRPQTKQLWLRLEIGSISVLSLLCFFILFHDLGGAALFEPDEDRNAEVGREILLINDWVTPHYNFIPRLDKPMFFYSLVALSYKLFGVSEWAARLPSALSGLLCILLMVIFARNFFGLGVALWSGLILVTSAEYFVLSRTVISDMTFSSFTALSLCTFYWSVHAERRVKRRACCLLMYAAMGFATLVKGPIGVVLPGMVILAYLLLTKKLALLRQMDLVFGTIVFLLVTAPWYAWIELRNPGYLRYFLLNEHLVRFFTSHFDRSEPWYYFFEVLGVGFLPWTPLILVIVNDLWKGPQDDATFFLLLWTVLPFLFFSFSDSKMPTYILPIYPAISALAGKAVVSMLKNPGRSWPLCLPWLTLLVPILYFALGLFWPSILHEPLQEAMHYIAEVIPAFLPKLILILFIISALAIWTILWSDQRSIYVLSCMVLLFVFNVFQQAMRPVSLMRSAKELAEKAAVHIAPADQIVIYNTYLSSLPFYLRIGRPTWVIWSGKKSTIMGSSYVAEKQPDPALGYERLLFSFEEFSERSKGSNRRLVIFVEEKHLRHLREKSGIFPKRLLAVGEVVLVATKRHAESLENSVYALPGSSADLTERSKNLVTMPALNRTVPGTVDRF